MSFRPLSLIVAAVLLAGPAIALATPAAAKTAQQQRMTDCNKQAAGKTGDARKAFMSTCLKGGAAAKTSPQERMKQCNAQAGKQSLKGDARKQFMSTCLKG